MTDGAVVVRVAQVRGSAPREVGACMVVASNRLQGSVGGGHLEWQATAHARALLGGQLLPRQVRYALGPNLGQCCGGEVVLEFTVLASWTQAQAALAAQAPALQPVAVFGAGHVGQALVRVLQPLPLRIFWFDSRPDACSGRSADPVTCEQVDPVQDAVVDLPARTPVLVMTHSHAQDLELIAACLQRQRRSADLPWIGMIGSATKWASFRQRLLARGCTEAELAQVTCPVGVPGIRGKQPEVIAVAVAAQLLQTRA